MTDDKIFSYTIDPKGINEVVDEKGNTIIAIRKVAWGSNKISKLEIRKWYITTDGERPNKGFSFLTDEGPTQLTDILLKNGYGTTEAILAALKEREKKKEIPKELEKECKKEISKKPVSNESIEDNEFFNPLELLS